MAKSVLYSVGTGGWDKWGLRFVNRAPMSREQHIVPSRPSVDQTKAALKRAISAAGAGGTLIVNVGHGAGGDKLDADQGMFELAPGGQMKITGHDMVGGYVDVFYDVNRAGPPSMSDKENDEKNNPNSPRLKRWRDYEEISTAFKNGKLREVALLTCRVGNSTEFLRKVANDWGVVIRAYRQRVALTEDAVTVGRKVSTHFYMHLENDPPAGKSADDLIVLEEEIPYAPNQTVLIGPPLTPAL